MSRGRLAVVVVLVFGLSLAPVGVTATSTVDLAPASQPADSAGTQDSEPARPSIDASINGDPIEADGFRVVMEEARLRLDVSMPGNETLDTVLVRLDGETVVDRSDPGSSVSINRSLPIGGGNNTVRVVAEGTNDEVRSMRFRVYLETVPPALDFESPVDTLPAPYRYPDLVIGRTDARFQGTFDDLTGFDIASFSFSRSGSDRFETFDVGGDGSFDRRVLLGYGRNDVELQTRDTLGNAHIRSFTVRVEDRDPPEVDLGFTSQQEDQPRYEVTGTVNDTVWIRNVSVRVFHYDRNDFQPSQRVYETVPDRRYRGRSRDRLNVSFDQTVRLLEGRNLVVVRARDIAGHSTIRRFFIRYTPDTEVAPTVSVIRNQTVVRNDSALDVRALISDDDRDFERVLVEAESLETGAVTDVESIRPTDNATFLLDRTLNVSAGVNRIQVTAFDGREESTTERFFINTSRQYPLEEPPDGYERIADEDEPTEQPEETPTATPVETVDRSTETRTKTETVPTTSVTSTPTPDEETDAGSDDTPESDEADEDDSDEADEDDSDESSGGLLGNLLVPLVVGIVVVVGGFVGYRQITRV